MTNTWKADTVSECNLKGYLVRVQMDAAAVIQSVTPLPMPPQLVILGQQFLVIWTERQS